MRAQLGSLTLLLALGCTGKGTVILDDSAVVDDSGVPGDDADLDGVPASEDCDDDDPSVGAAQSWYTDGDDDGYGDDASATTSCDAPAGAVAEGGDCDDGDPAYHPGATEDDCTDPNDYNCDGSSGTVDADGDGYAACEECDDGSDISYPGATEVCDDLDNDCDGVVDNDAVDGSTWYPDTDGDGLGDYSAPTSACSQPEGYVADGTDCDDTDATVSEGSTWYADADGDGYGDASSTVVACEAPEGYVPDDTDCDDTDATVQGERSWYEDADSDGWGNPSVSVVGCAGPDGYVKNKKDCDDTSADVGLSATEVCDGVDNDCDGTVDWGLGVPSSYDSIQDAIDAASDGDTVCVAGGTYVEQIDFSGKDLVLDGWEGAEATIIDGDGEGPVVTFESGEGTDATMKGFTVTNGSRSKGAGVYVKDADPTLADLIITANVCTSGSGCYGAGLYAENSGVTVSSSTISDNEISSTGYYSYGAGVYLTNAETTFTDVQIVDNTILGSSSGYSYGYGYGAGVALTTGSTFTMDGGSLAGNALDMTASSYAYGGGAGFFSNGADATLDNVWVVDNAATGAGGQLTGGGLYLYYDGTTTLTNVIVANNSISISGSSGYGGGTQGSGGGAYIGQSATLELENVDIVGNDVSAQRAYGGGIYLYYYSTLDAVNTNFVSNTVAGSYGASGGAIAAYSSYYLSDFSVSYSNIYGNTSEELSNVDDLVGSHHNISVDPTYEDTSGAEAIDWDLHLSSGSGCIDVGSTSIDDTDGSQSDIGAWGGPGADL